MQRLSAENCACRRLLALKMATTTLKSGMTVTIDCSRGGTGYVYTGAIPFEEKTIKTRYAAENSGKNDG